MKTSQTELMPESQAMERRADMPVAQSDPESILRYAIDKGADVSVIERMMVIRRELKAENAKTAFDNALAAFQSECPVIVKNKQGPSGAYRYAPIDAALAQKLEDGRTVGKLLKSHGFSYKINSIVKENWVKAVCIIKNSGHEEVSEFEVPVDDRNKMMTAPQKYGGAMTFAKRYAFFNGFGILTADEDLDAAAKRPKPPGPSQETPEGVIKKALSAQLWELLRPVRGEQPNWRQANEWLTKNKIIEVGEEAPKFTPDKFREVMTKSKIVLGVA